MLLTHQKNVFNALRKCGKRTKKKKCVKTLKKQKNEL
jgi:hypothetical protein